MAFLMQRPVLPVSSEIINYAEAFRLISKEGFLFPLSWRREHFKSHTTGGCLYHLAPSYLLLCSNPRFVPIPESLTHPSPLLLIVAVTFSSGRSWIRCHLVQRGHLSTNQTFFLTIIQFNYFISTYSPFVYRLFFDSATCPFLQDRPLAFLDHSCLCHV